MLATLLEPDGGRATVLGHDVVVEPLAVRRRIGLAGQFAAVDEELSGRENLPMIGRLYRLPGADARRRAGEVLERFRLADAADRRVATYSGGMRRRLDLGASLVGRPPVLLLDEPTTGLDPRSRQELWGVVDELRREGTTVLLTSQYLEEADRLAQRIAVVDNGRIVAQGTATELKAAIGTEVLAVRTSDPAGAREAGVILSDLATGDAPAVDAATGEIRFVVADPGASAEVVRRLDAQRLPIAAIELRRPSLPPRHARIRRPRLPDPGATTAPASQGGSLTLFQVVRELHALLACWHGACPLCRRELPPDHPLRAPPN
ncbi:MAG: ATP-binding cassette domain-containing protein [Solirubrobacteraceae bacterium]